MGEGNVRGFIRDEGEEEDVFGGRLDRIIRMEVGNERGGFWFE